MANTIQIKRTITAGKIPTGTDLTAGELGVNLTDKKLYCGDGSSVFEIANKSDLDLKANLNSPTFTGQLIFPNNSRINGIEHFYQTTKPITRGDGSALVVGDRWWKTDTGEEWFWNGTYWLSSLYFTESYMSMTTLSATNLNFGYNFNSGTGSYFNLFGRADGLTNNFFYDQVIFRCTPSAGTFDVNNYWTFTHNIGGIVGAFTTQQIVTHILNSGTYDGQSSFLALSQSLVPNNTGTSMRVGHNISVTKVGNPPNVGRVTSSYKIRLIYS